MLSNAKVTPTLPAADLERARKFYTEVVGLKESGHQQDGGIIFDCGDGTQLYIYQRGPVTVEHTLANFEVEDIEAEMTELRSRGLEFENYDLPGLKTENGIMTMPGFKASWFKDSEGNILGLGQEVK